MAGHPRVGQASPASPIPFAAVAQSVERILGKDEVGGSNPPSSSKKTRCPARDSGFLLFLEVISIGKRIEQRIEVGQNEPRGNPRPHRYKIITYRRFHIFKHFNGSSRRSPGVASGLSLIWRRAAAWALTSSISWRWRSLLACSLRLRVAIPGRLIYSSAIASKVFNGCACKFFPFPGHSDGMGRGGALRPSPAASAAIVADLHQVGRSSAWCCFSRCRFGCKVHRAAHGFSRRCSYRLQVPLRSC